MRILAKYSPHAFALFRIIAGLMFMSHGTQKLFDIPAAPRPVPLNAMMMLAGLIELVCGLLIVFGLFAGVAALIASGEMAAAYLGAHAPRALWPTVNQGELAVLYCFAFLYVATHGAGLFSLDSLWHRRSSTDRTRERLRAA